MSRTQLLLLILFVSAGAVGGWAWERYAPAPESSDEMDLVALDMTSGELEEFALRSCRCEMSSEKEDRDKCWKNYQSKTENSAYAQAADACAPVNSNSECILTTEGEVCLTTSYNVVVITDPELPRVVCTFDEAKAIEKAYSEAWSRHSEGISSENEIAWDRANQLSLDAVNQQMREIVAGVKVPQANPNSVGCV